MFSWYTWIVLTGNFSIGDNNYVYKFEIVQNNLAM